MVTVIVDVGVGVNVGVTEGGVSVFVNDGLTVESGVRIDPMTGVGVVVAVGKIVRLAVGMEEVIFGWTVPVILVTGKPLVGVGVELI